MKKIKLEIVALSSGSTQAHSYAVILAEVNGQRRLPIVIGTFEAQAIVVALEGISPGRPLTHDLFHNFISSFEITIREVLIYQLKDKVFYAKLICIKDGLLIEIDSRTSDGLALAVRIGCPIYVYENILEEAGLVIDRGAAPETKEKEEKTENIQETTPEDTPQDDLKLMTLNELETLLQNMLENEDYIQAIAIRDELNRRNKEK